MVFQEKSNPVILSFACNLPPSNALEDVINKTLERNGYQFVDKKNFDSAKYLDQPVFTVQYPVAKSVYDTQMYCDFIIYHPEKYSNCLIIESKWQQSSDSVDEKFPFLVLNIREKYPSSTIVVLDGGGYKKGAEKWLREQADDKLIHVFNMMEFQKWSNSEEL